MIRPLPLQLEAVIARLPRRWPAAPVRSATARAAAGRRCPIPGRAIQLGLEVRQRAIQPALPPGERESRPRRRCRARPRARSRPRRAAAPRPDAVIASASERTSSGIAPSTCRSARSRPVARPARVLRVEHECGAIQQGGLRLDRYRDHAGRVVSSSRRSRIETRSGRGSAGSRGAARAEPLRDPCPPGGGRPGRRGRAAWALDAQRLDAATQQVARPVIDGQPADQLRRVRPAAEREARQLEPAQADLKAIERISSWPARHARRAGTWPAAMPSGRRAARAAGRAPTARRAARAHDRRSSLRHGPGQARPLRQLDRQRDYRGQVGQSPPK